MEKADVSSPKSGLRAMTSQCSLFSLGPPRQNTYFPTEHTRVIPLGLTFTLHERVIGWPSPNFTWSRADGKPMGNVDEYNSFTTADLVIYSLTYSELGNYTLTANNSFGTCTTVFEVGKSCTQLYKAVSLEVDIILTNQV